MKIDQIWALLSCTSACLCQFLSIEIAPTLAFPLLFPWRLLHLFVKPCSSENCQLLFLTNMDFLWEPNFALLLGTRHQPATVRACANNPVVMWKMVGGEFREPCLAPEMSPKPCHQTLCAKAGVGGGGERHTWNGTMSAWQD